MTSLLQQVFSAAAQLTEQEQNLLAARWLAELSTEEAFDEKVASSAGKLVVLANQALAEHQAGQTEELIPERL